MHKQNIDLLNRTSISFDSGLDVASSMRWPDTFYSHYPWCTRWQILVSPLYCYSPSQRWQRENCPLTGEVEEKELDRRSRRERVWFCLANTSTALPCSYGYSWAENSITSNVGLNLISACTTHLTHVLINFPVFLFRITCNRWTYTSFFYFIWPSRMWLLTYFWQLKTTQFIWQVREKFHLW